MATLYKASQFFITTLNVGGGIDSSQTTGITIADDSGIDDVTDPGIALINYADPLNTSIAEWVTYTSISSKVLQGVTRGAEGFAAKAHDNAVQVAFPISKSHINNLADALAIGGSLTNGVTGVLDEDDMATNSAVKLATQQSIKAYVDSKVDSVTDEDSAGSSSTSSSTYADITGADVSVTITVTSNILLLATVQAYGNVDLAPYTIQWHDGTSNIGGSSRVYLRNSNARTSVCINTVVTNKSAGTYTYTLQHKSEDNSSSLTAETISCIAFAVPA